MYVMGLISICGILLTGRRVVAQSSTPTIGIRNGVYVWPMVRVKLIKYICETMHYMLTLVSRISNRIYDACMMYAVVVVIFNPVMHQWYVVDLPLHVYHVKGP